MFLLAFADSIQLFPDGTLFIHIALILIMIWILNRTFFKPINRILESREKHKGGAGGEAEQIIADASEKEARLTKEMLSARSEGYDLIEKERAGAIDLRARRVAEAKAETAAAFASERQTLTEQTESARASIAANAQEMADKIAANVLKG
jgi:F-type H+-transporting ATPase subunit b